MLSCVCSEPSCLHEPVPPWADMQEQEKLVWPSFLTSCLLLSLSPDSIPCTSHTSHSSLCISLCLLFLWPQTATASGSKPGPWVISSACQCKNVLRFSSSTSLVSPEKKLTKEKWILIEKKYWKRKNCVEYKAGKFLFKNVSKMYLSITKSIPCSVHPQAHCVYIHPFSSTMYLVLGRLMNENV